MNRKINLLMLLFFAWPALHAQVSISLQQPQPFRLRPGDVLNAMVINSSTAQTLYFIGSITDARSGKPAVEARTATLMIPAGTTTLSEAMLQPRYTYGSGIAEQTGELPYGNYELCLHAYSSPDNEDKGEGCISVEVTPLSPPLLISPDNGSVIYEQYPLLTWLPPGPADSRRGVLYDLKLVELLPNQTAYDAIQRNFGVLDAKDIRSTTLQYPMNATRLEEGKTYAWKVLAKGSNGVMIGETEVWTFRYVKEKETAPVQAQSDPYIIADPHAPTSNVYSIHKRMLYIKLSSRYSNERISFAIARGNKESRDCAPQVTPGSGDKNLYIINLSDCNIKNNEVYILRIFSNGNEQTSLRFKNEQ